MKNDNESNVDKEATECAEMATAPDNTSLGENASYDAAQEPVEEVAEVAEVAESGSTEEPVAEPQGYSEAEMQAMLAEAEQRGYLRGRNESIEALMQAPAEYESPRQESAPSASTSEVPFLSRRKVSIWNL